MRYLIKGIINQISKNKINYRLERTQQTILGVRYLFKSIQDSPKQKHTQEQMTSFKKVSQSQQEWFIQPDDYDLLACPPENLIYNSSKRHKVLLLPNLTLENK
jgi:hypothetical protein